ncbi:hypothetical protein DAPPUDRAFT_114127 [Daphnia pulex]|uniref:DUF4806 domain-containing protein n=1 Tax=Daphnia pulex TaxID=6669 RepID=E9HH51_DAPPU|nr:hypothetical protein DAPPUDRAFT_114127 [Daphnia pulex]|eukprot:EFX68931.1 hypothetical protein DAPPUDRAFT_114127 [Daphnia pulex]
MVAKLPKATGSTSKTPIVANLVKNRSKRDLSRVNYEEITSRSSSSPKKRTRKDAASKEVGKPDLSSAQKTTPAPRRQGKQIQEAVQEERQEKEIVDTEQQEPKQPQVGEEESDGSEKDQDGESAKDPAEDIATDDDKDSAADEESAKGEDEESDKDEDSDEESPKDQDEVYKGHSENLEQLDPIQVPISAQENDSRGDDPDDSMRVAVIDPELLNYATVYESTLVEPLVMETTTEHDGTIVYRFSPEELAALSGREKDMRVPVSVARLLISYKQEIVELKSLMARVLEKLDILTSQNRKSNSGEDTVDILSTRFKLPLKTRKTVMELDAELDNNMELKQQIQLALSLLGGKNLKEIVRLTMRGLMAKEVRVQYVAQKVTKGKYVFKQHKNLFGFIIDVVRQGLARKKLPAATQQDIVHQIGLLFTGSGDEDGGVVARKRKKAMEQAVLDKHFKNRTNDREHNASGDDGSDSSLNDSGDVLV